MNSHARNWSSAWLALRSLLWTILLPGVFAGYVPWRFFGLGRTQFDLTSATQLLGFVCIGAGVELLAACIFEFARSGRGTLSLVDAPRHLVVRGLYRYVRNPMYLCVTKIILGEAFGGAFRGSRRLLGVLVRVCESLRHRYEEPTLRLRFGESSDEYTQRVGRWIPRFRRDNE